MESQIKGRIGRIFIIAIAFGLSLVAASGCGSVQHQKIKSAPVCPKDEKKLEESLFETQKDYKNNIDEASRAAGFKIKFPSNPSIGELEHLGVWKSSTEHPSAHLYYSKVSISEESIPKDASYVGNYKREIEWLNGETDRFYENTVKGELGIDVKKEDRSGYYYLIHVHGCEGMARDAGYSYDVFRNKKEFGSLIEWWDNGIKYSIGSRDLKVKDLISIGESLYNDTTN